MERLSDTLKRLGLDHLLAELPADAGDRGEEASPRCLICRDAGYLRHDVPVGHPDFGKIVPCSCRAPDLAAQRQERLTRLSNLGPLTRLTFATIIRQGRAADPARQERYRRCVEAAEAFAANPQGWLVLLGPPGCGKTHLAAAIANARIAAGEPALFVVVPDLLDRLRSTFAPGSGVTYDELFESARNVPLLILDDLGTQASTPWASEKLFQILNHRYNAQLPTVVTTNRHLEELDERLRARLTDPTLSSVQVVEERQPPALARLGGGQELLARMTFATFDPNGAATDEKQQASLRTALSTAIAFAEDPQGWLVLQGECGCGKTHLAAAIANHVQARGGSAYFVAVPDLLDYLRSAYSPDSKVGYDELFESVRSAQLLILDDLGTQSSTPWAEEKLFQLFNHRYNALLPTVITTNLRLDDPRLDARLASRMMDSKRVANVVRITAPDFRLQGAGYPGVQRGALPARTRPSGRAR